MGRGFEALLIVLGSTALVGLTNRDQISSLSRTVPQDLGDPLYFAWQLAWVGHVLRTDPGGLWTTPAFSRAPDNLAFTDTILGYFPLSFLASPGQEGALWQFNVARLIAAVLAFVGAYVLARVLGAGVSGSLVAGAGFGYAPWRLEQVNHLNVSSTGGIALSLALLAYGHGWSLRHGWDPTRLRARWLLAGWAVACWQLTLGFANGVYYVYALALVVVAGALGWLFSGRRRLPAGVVAAELIGGLTFTLTAFLLARPYFRVVAAHPEAARGESYLPLFSPPWRGLLTAPSTDWFWGSRQRSWRSGLSWVPEMVLSPGMVLLGLAVLGVFFSLWPWRRRLALLITTALTTALTMGTAFPGEGRWTYLPLFEHAPGWQALRTPGRLMIWVTLGLCLLAAGAVGRLFEVISGLDVRPVRGIAVGAVIALAPFALVVGEGCNTFALLDVPRAPIPVAQLRAPILLLPTDQLADYQMMLWGTDGWPVLANGDSGFNPTAQIAMRSAMAAFPDATSVQELHRLGVRTVVVIRSQVPGTSWAAAADAPVVGLPLQRTDRGDAVVFELE